MATTGGVEPPFADSESAVLPLDDVAMKMAEMLGFEPRPTRFKVSRATVTLHPIKIVCTN